MVTLGLLRFETIDAETRHSVSSKDMGSPFTRFEGCLPRS